LSARKRFVLEEKGKAHRAQRSHNGIYGKKFDKRLKALNFSTGSKAQGDSIIFTLGVPLRVGLFATMVCLYGQTISTAIPNAI
jgi:hypothetical protein